MFVRRLSLFLGLLFLINFSLFWVHGFYLGGNAINGKVVDGHFFVGMNGHFAEVTPQQYSLNRVHAISVFVMLGVNFAIQGIAYFLGGECRIKPKQTRLHLLWALLVVALMISIVAAGAFNLPSLSRLAWYCVPLPFVAGYIELMAQEWTTKQVSANAPDA